MFRLLGRARDDADGGHAVVGTRGVAGAEFEPVDGATGAEVVAVLFELGCRGGRGGRGGRRGRRGRRGRGGRGGRRRGQGGRGGGGRGGGHHGKRERRRAASPGGAADLELASTSAGARALRAAAARANGASDGSHRADAPEDAHAPDTGGATRAAARARALPSPNGREDSSDDADAPRARRRGQPDDADAPHTRRRGVAQGPLDAGPLHTRRCECEWALHTRPADAHRAANARSLSSLRHEPL